jgi:hypothetical protein
MKKILTGSLIRTIDLFPQNIILLTVGTLMLILPVIATTGQFISANYFQKSIPVMLLYWPGSDFTLSITMIVWVFMGMVFLSYLAGIIYMLDKRTLVKVIILTILAFICTNLLKLILISVTGWQEKSLPDMAGKADSVLLAQWHNPIWEEIVFRGIPLLILLAIEKYITKNRTITGMLIYLIIPSVACGLYHIPGHGLIRFFDSTLLGIFFAWLALRYTFFAPVVMHYIADALIVFNLDKITSIHSSEIYWLVQYGRSIGSFFWLLTMLLVALIPVLIIYTYRKTIVLKTNT